MKKKIEAWLLQIEEALEKFLPQGEPAEIHEAMRYAVLGGGKRFRPLLTLAACEAVGGDPRKALVPACAVEFIHGYSLVHDDLPALDNDEMRRGRPTCHRKFGEALAILAGDALLTRAFQLLGEVRPAAKAVQLIQELSQAAGTQGMIGGQVIDIRLAQSDSEKNIETLDGMSRNKTGRLIQAGAVLGALTGTASVSKITKVRRFGGALGLAFQVVDDIMDGDGYLQLMNPETAQQKAQTLIGQARAEALSFEKKGKALLELVELLSSRNHVPVGLKD